MADKEKFDVKTMVADKLIAEMEKGVIPWERPWMLGGDAAYNRMTERSHPGQNYSFLNSMMLNKPGEYASFKQWQQCGARVKKGEQSSIVVFWSQKLYQAKNAAGEKQFDSDGNPVMKPMWFLKYYRVFHIDQVENAETGAPMQPLRPVPIMPDKAVRVENAEQMIKAYLEKYKIGFRENDTQAYYSPATDSVAVPPREAFKSTEERYSTIFHELTHSTGHKSRLNREGITAPNARFGTAVYSKEELVAEMGAAILLHTLGMATEHTDTNSAAYLQSWLKALKNNKNWIVDAASKADKAATLIRTLNIAVAEKDTSENEEAA